MSRILLHLKSVGLTFGGRPLLQGAELSVAEGERVALVGRNGSGKSTLLKMAAGMIEPDTGERWVQPGTTIRYLPQEPDLTAFATVLDYVEAGLGPRMIRTAASLCCASWDCPAMKTRSGCLAARSAARPLPGRWRPIPTSCCSTSRPIISTCRRSNGLSPSSNPRAPPSC